MVCHQHASFVLFIESAAAAGYLVKMPLQASALSTMHIFGMSLTDIIGQSNVLCSLVSWNSFWCQVINVTAIVQQQTKYILDSRHLLASWICLWSVGFKSSFGCLRSDEDSTRVNILVLWNPSCSNRIGQASMNNVKISSHIIFMDGFHHCKLTRGGKLCLLIQRGLNFTNRVLPFCN